MKRERAKIQLQEENGTMVEVAQMVRALENMEEGSERVPLVVRDRGGIWWWRGLRAVHETPGGGERVTIDGRQCMAQRRSFTTDRRGDVSLWLVDDMPAAGPVGRFTAPLPLATKADGQAYYTLGLDGLRTQAECAKILGWKGEGASDAAEKFRELVHTAARGARPEPMASRLAAVAGLVVIPGEASPDVPPRMTWAESCAVLEKLRAEVEKLRAEVAELRGLVV